MAMLCPSTDDDYYTSLPDLLHIHQNLPSNTDIIANKFCTDDELSEFTKGLTRQKHKTRTNWAVRSSTYLVLLTAQLHFSGFLSPSILAMAGLDMPQHVHVVMLTPVKRAWIGHKL